MAVSELTRKHNDWRSGCINLVASENKMSPAASEALVSDMGSRYFFKEIFETETGLKYDYCGAKYIREIYETTEDVAKRLFNANYVNLEMLSGHLANMNILLSYCKPGDTIICSDTRFGGYPGLAEDKLPKFLGINIKFIPQEEIGGVIDLDKLERLIIETKPKIVMLSSSITIFPFPVREVTNICHKYGIPFCYDASHPLGLIAGGEFQAPFEEGADLIIGSTHKSLPGPQGGIILGNNKNYEAIHQATDFVVVDNIHVNRVAALGVTLLETEKFGKEYARQIVINSKALAGALIKKGFSIAFSEQGCSESHQFLIQKDFGCYSKFTLSMEAAGIILDNSGRFGVSEVTRMGMKAPDMTIIADLISQVVTNGVDDSIRDKVIGFMNEFKTVHYCFR
ncbi:MAG: aminotransferase class V-fold PLP-dependent enzyme [Colwellia sp.]|jgi:Glycine/serine hydroxymethyltransferase